MIVLATWVPCDEPRDPMYDAWRSGPTSVYTSHLSGLWDLKVTFW